MKLYYSHVDRKITDGKDEPVSIEQAQRLMSEGAVEDWNGAFTRLMNCDWDMEAVEQEYLELEAINFRDE